MSFGERRDLSSASYAAGRWASVKSKERVLFGGFIFVFFISFLLVTYWIRATGWQKASVGPTSDSAEIIEEVARQPWDPQSFPVTGTILEFDREKKKLILEFSWPPQVFGRRQDLTLVCDDDDYWVEEFTIESGTNLSPEELHRPVEQLTYQEFFDMVENNQGLGFSGYCVEEECREVNRRCKLQVIKSI